MSGADSGVNAAMSQIVEDYKDVSGFDLVEPAHMELAEPSIASGKCPLILQFCSCRVFSCICHLRRRIYCLIFSVTCWIHSLRQVRRTRRDVHHLPSFFPRAREARAG